MKQHNKILLALVLFLFAMRYVWCNVGTGVCGTCGWWGKCNDGKCEGFVPFIPGEYLPFSKCISQDHGSDNGSDQGFSEEHTIEDETIYSSIMALPEPQQRDKMHIYALYKRALGNKDFQESQKHYKNLTIEQPLEQQPLEQQRLEQQPLEQRQWFPKNNTAQPCPFSRAFPKIMRPSVQSFKSVRPTHKETSHIMHLRRF